MHGARRGSCCGDAAVPPWGPTLRSVVSFAPFRYGAVVEDMPSMRSLGGTREEHPVARRRPSLAAERPPRERIEGTRSPPSSMTPSCENPCNAATLATSGTGAAERSAPRSTTRRKREADQQAERETCHVARVAHVRGRERRGGEVEQRERDRRHREAARKEGRASNRRADTPAEERKDAARDADVNIRRRRCFDEKARERAERRAAQQQHERTRTAHQRPRDRARGSQHCG